MEKDKDVVAQSQAIAMLQAVSQHPFSVINALNNLLNDSKVCGFFCVEFVAFSGIQSGIACTFAGFLEGQNWGSYCTCTDGFWGFSFFTMLHFLR